MSYDTTDYDYDPPRLPDYVVLDHIAEYETEAMEMAADQWDDANPRKREIWFLVSWKPDLFGSLLINAAARYGTERERYIDKNYIRIARELAGV